MKPDLRERLTYAFDNLMSRGPSAMIAALCLLSGLIILVAALLVSVVGVSPDGAGLGKLLWLGLMHTLDAGMITGDDGPWAYAFVMLVVTLAGLFVFGALIGFLSSAIDARLDELRKGRSRVLESGHTIVLGWSDQVFPILSELIVANANQRRSAIAILAPEDKVAMEDAIRERIPERGRTRIVCRSGSPLSPHDLGLVNPQAAKAIIVLSSAAGDVDAEVMKTVLAITNSPDRRASPYHIVAQVHDPDYVDLLRLVGREELVLVNVGEFVARTIVQTSQQTGLSVVWTELLDFEGDEIYLAELPALAGRTYGDALHACEHSTVIGLASAVGGVRVNPPMDTVIAPGERIVAVSADDDTVVLTDRPAPVDESALVAPPVAIPEPERVLVLGWNQRGPVVARELDGYLAPGSALTIVAEPSPAEDLADLLDQFVNLTVTVHEADITRPQILDELGLADYQRIIVLSYADRLDVQQADAITLATLVRLRDAEARTGERYTIVSEMLDPQNRELARVTQADDFIVSGQLVSLLMTQLAENPLLKDVFEDLLDAAGSELYLRPLGDYVVTGRPVNFATVVEAARRRGETAIGYRLVRNDQSIDPAGGVRVNPPKSGSVTFQPTDRVIVLAED